MKNNGAIRHSPCMPPHTHTRKKETWNNNNTRGRENKIFVDKLEKCAPSFVSNQLFILRIGQKEREKGEQHSHNIIIIIRMMIWHNNAQHAVNMNKRNDAGGFLCTFSISFFLGKILFSTVKAVNNKWIQKVKALRVSFEIKTLRPFAYLFQQNRKVKQFNEANGLTRSLIYCSTFIKSSSKSSCKKSAKHFTGNMIPEASRASKEERPFSLNLCKRGRREIIKGELCRMCVS